MSDELGAIRERLGSNYRDQPAMVWQDIAWLLAEAEHARQPHVRITGEVSYPIQGWVECERCGQVTYNTSTGSGT